MFTVTRYPHGTFSWVDCSTSDVAARHFYAGLMDWDIEEAPMGGGLAYYTFLRDGHRVAALSELPPNMAQLPPAWNSYVTVDDVDALMPTVVAGGGQIIEPPFDVPDSARIALIRDAEGAALCLHEPRGNVGAGLVNTPGALSWNELWSADLQTAKAFYSAMFGWTFEDSGNSPVYSTIFNSGRRNGGILAMDGEMAAETPPTWVPHFSVADIEASARRILELGGAVHVGPWEADGTGRWLLFSDPQGAHCYLMQLNEPEPWPGHRR